MSATTEIIAALRAAGIELIAFGTHAGQGAVFSVSEYPHPVRFYAWQVTDNGQATGTVRPADERRIQAIGSRTQLIDVSPEAETVVLGWCDGFGPEPLIVAFNPYGVAGRVNGKIQRKVDVGIQDARASDSQQFRQSLLDEATATGIAFGCNQHGEYVIAMRPAFFIDYLRQYKPTYQFWSETVGLPLAGWGSMSDLVASAEIEEAEPVDVPNAGLLSVFDLSTIADSRERVAREIAIRRGQAIFRRHLLEAYGCCAMTGCTVEAALEAAHIVPYQGPGTNHLANGLLLRADVHTLFDFGFLAVDPTTLTVLVAHVLNGTEYEVLRGRRLLIGHSSISPSLEALQMHRRLAEI